MITEKGIRKALEFAQGSISNSSFVPEARISNYFEIFKDRNITDEQFLEAVKKVLAEGSNFLPKPKEIFGSIVAPKRTDHFKITPPGCSGLFICGNCQQTWPCESQEAKR